MTISILVVASETTSQQEARRRRSGQASHETYIETLHKLDATCEVATISCVEGPDASAGPDLQGFDGIVFAGSPIQMHEETAETRSAAAFMARVYESGTPSFGSCAGLQIAAVGAGGTTKLRGSGIEAGIARRIVATQAGRDHPMLANRPATWDALAMHTSVVDETPSGTTILASAEGTPVEAAEFRCGNGLFWGVQYHPEITLLEVADALRQQTDELIAEGMARNRTDAEAHADALDALGRDPDRADLAWQLGLDRQVTDFKTRNNEVINFLHFIAGR